MSGHNKWSKIKKGKEVKDKQKSSVFSKLARIITLAVIEGGGIRDPENNIKLRLAIEKAKSVNFPKDNIERAIEKGVGPNRPQLKEITYEAFGPAGISMIISATTDNVNRTLGEVRRVLETNNGKLGNQGSVSYLFKKCGLCIFNLEDFSEKEIFDFAEILEAFDIDKDEQEYAVYFPYENIGKAHELTKSSKPVKIEIDYKALNYIKLTDEVETKEVINLLEALESLEDVQKVYSNGKN